MKLLIYRWNDYFKAEKLKLSINLHSVVAEVTHLSIKVWSLATTTTEQNRISIKHHQCVQINDERKTTLFHYFSLCRLCNKLMFQPKVSEVGQQPLSARLRWQNSIFEALSKRSSKLFAPQQHATNDTNYLLAVSLFIRFHQSFNHNFPMPRNLL